MGFCTTVARRLLVPSLLGAFAACEPSAPAAFDPDGATADAAALDAAFETPLMRALTFAGPAIDLATGGVEAAAVSTAPDSGLSLRVLRAMGGAVRPRFSSGELPSGVLGRSYVYDPAVGAYVASGADGAPPAGARFQLYAVEPATGNPVEPLVPLGYVDVISESTSGMRVRVGDDTGVRLDYRISADVSGTESRLRVDGFIADAATRADFAFDNRIELAVSGGTMQLSEMRSLPARDVALECASLVQVSAGLPPELDIDLTLSGPNGELGVTGAYALGGSGALEVDVNGGSYAQVSVAGGEFTVAGAAGEALPANAVGLLGRVITARESGLAIFDRLVRPVETLVTP